MINSPKGKSLFGQALNGLNAEKVALDITKYSDKYNICLSNNPKPSSQISRNSFFKDLDKLEFDNLFEKHLKTVWLERKKKKTEYLKSLDKDISI